MLVCISHTHLEAGQRFVLALVCNDSRGEAGDGL